MGETDLDRLLRGMSATLREGVFVFATRPDKDIPDGLQPLMTFQEAEGTTLILRQEEAEQFGIAHVFPSRMITLEVHSSLEAVGFIARIATALAAQGMGVNPVSGFFHDHLFVPLGREQEALDILDALSKGSG
ncbi:MAG: ACT domain-containing protein [Rhodospirillaceae bacterium]